MKLMKQGWECPKCGRVYAPWISQCDLCGAHSIIYRYLSSGERCQTIKDPHQFNAQKDEEDQND